MLSPMNIYSCYHGMRAKDKSSNATLQTNFDTTIGKINIVPQEIVLFDYRKGRGREGPNDILKDYQGYLQTDGYVGYDDFEKRSGIILLHCMAHARRKFVEALGNDKARAEYALNMFQQLYAIERKIKDEELTDDALLELRQQQAVPVLKNLKEWMREEYPKVLPRSPIGQAITYCLPRWEKLSIYTTNAML